MGDKAVMDNRLQKDVFLSHRSTDKEIVRKLAKDIESLNYKSRNLTTWLDEAEIHPGQSITGMINQGLENSRFIALILTPDYFSSESGWTDAEWHAAIYRDPDNRGGHILPILAKNCPYIPALIKHLRLIDIRGKRYDQGLKELVSILREEPIRKPVVYRGQLITLSASIDRISLIAERSAIDAYPDVVQERLYCNLLPVERLPKYLYSAPIADNVLRPKSNGGLAVPSKQELIALIREEQKKNSIENPFTPAFRIYENNILTFHDLEDTEGPFSSIVDTNDTAEISTEEFIADEDQRRILVSLLNMSLRRHANRVGLVIDETKKNSDRFFFPPVNGSSNIITWRPKQKWATRTVAKPCYKDGQFSFWIHRAAYLRMLFLTGHFYIQIEPTWVITEDGFKVKGGANIGRLLIKWTGPERNLHLLYHIRFWTTILRGKKVNAGGIKIRSGDDQIYVSSIPAIVDQSVGVSNDKQNLLESLDEAASLLANEEEMIIEEGINLDLEQLADDQEENPDNESSDDEVNDE